MSHPKPSDIYGYQSPTGGGFLNYVVGIEGVEGKFAAYHSDLEVVKDYI